MSKTSCLRAAVIKNKAGSAERKTKEVPSGGRVSKSCCKDMKEEGWNIFIKWRARTLSCMMNSPLSEFDAMTGSLVR